MFYIKEELFKTKDGDAFKLTEALGEGNNGRVHTIEAKSSDILRAVLGTYDPQPEMGQALKWRPNHLLNQALDLFESGDFPSGYIELDDELATVCKLVIQWTVPTMGPGWRRNAEAILNLIEKAPQQLPPKATSKKGASEDSQR